MTIDAPIIHGATTRPHRSRWAAVGAAVAVTIGGGGLLTTSATLDSGERGVFVPIAPCRLLDTRAGSDNVGPRSTPLGEGETYATAVRGSNGNCSIPADAIGVSMNVAIIQPSAASFLTVFPPDAARPLAANLNWVAGQAPTPNAVTADLSADGRIAFYNLSGTVHLTADVNGYYVDHTHDDRYYTEAELARPTSGNGGIGVLERMTNQQLANNRWDQDPARPATVAVGGDPDGIAFDGRYIWVANRGTDTVSKIDPRTNTVLTTIATADDPSRLTWDGATLWVTHYRPGKVSKIDPGSSSVTSFDLPGGPYAMAFDGASIWIALYDANQAVKIEPATNQILQTMATGADPYDLVFDGTHIWTSNFDGDSLTRITVSTSAVTTVLLAAGASPVGLAFDGQLLWFTEYGPDVIRFVHPTSLTVSSPFILPANGSPHFPVFDGSRIWVPNCADDTITLIDTLTYTTTTAPAGNCPFGTAFDGTNVWITNSLGDSVMKAPARS